MLTVPLLILLTSFCSFLESKNYSIEAELNLQPQNTVKIKESSSSQIINLLSLLEDHDDVQKVEENPKTLSR